MPLCVTQIGARQQILVHADGPIDLPPPAKQVAESEMCLQRIFVHLGHAHEQLQGFVGLTIQYEVEPAEIVGIDGRWWRLVASATEVRERPTSCGGYDEEPCEKECRLSRHRAAEGCVGS
jgi:hypothetical protein